jgi:hypothetical protein
MTKNLFPFSAEQIIHAAKLLEGLSRYKQLIEDVNRENDEIGLPIITLSDNRKITIYVAKDDFIGLIKKNVHSIQDELDELGVTYDRVY